TTLFRSGRRGEGQERNHVDLRVTEVVALIARAGDALGWDAPLVRASRGLRQLVQAPARGLLLHGPARQLDVRARPEVVEVVALVRILLAEALRADPVQGETATVEQLAVRDGAGGVVGHGLADGQGVARGQVGAEDVPAQGG